MAKLATIVIVIIIVIVGIYAWTNRAGAPTTENLTNSTSTMLVTSPSFQNDSYIPQKFTCDGGNINPELQIQNVPSEAKSLALVMHDPDAPMAGGFTHWFLWNIDPKTTVVKQESVPASAEATAGKPQSAMEGKNGAGKIGYTGPCPPPGHGIHHYHFYFYALDSMLNLDASTATKVQLEAAMQNHILAEAEIVGLYQRQ